MQKMATRELDPTSENVWSSDEWMVDCRRGITSMRFWALQHASSFNWSIKLFGCAANVLCNSPPPLNCSRNSNNCNWCRQGWCIRMTAFHNRRNFSWFDSCFSCVVQTKGIINWYVNYCVFVYVACGCVPDLRSLEIWCICEQGTFHFGNGIVVPKLPLCLYQFAWVVVNLVGNVYSAVNLGWGLYNYL